MGLQLDTSSIYLHLTVQGHHLILQFTQVSLKAGVSYFGGVMSHKTLLKLKQALTFVEIL